MSARRRSWLLPVVIVTGGAAAIACGCSEGFDAATGCCVTYCNAAEPSYHACDTGRHAGTECVPPYAPGEDTGGIDDTGETTAPDTGRETSGPDSGASDDSADTAAVGDTGTCTDTAAGDTGCDSG